MSYRLTILGCGPSGGVPRVGAMWGRCDPQNPKNRRRRCSVLFERSKGNKSTRLLVDTSPDLRNQLLDARLDALDGVVFTHDHADHTHGIDDLRPVCYAMKRQIDVYFDKTTSESLQSRFAYCFKKEEGSDYKPILRGHEIEVPGLVEIDGDGGKLSVQTVAQQHGQMSSIGLRVGNVGYSPDISGFEDGGAEMMEGLDVWIVDALRYQPHPSHFHVRKALQWIEKLQPKHAYLTHMTTDLDYEALKRDLPDNVSPAYDGLQIRF